MIPAPGLKESLEQALRRLAEDGMARERSNAPLLHTIRSFLRKVRRYLTQGQGKNLQVYHVTLTYNPRIYNRETRLDAVTDLARFIARRDGECAFFGAEISPKGRLHWHGIIITSRTRREIQKRWADSTGARIRKGTQKLGLLHWQNKRYTTKFKLSLSKWTWYCFKSIPAPMADVPVEDRIIASGALLEFWNSLGMGAFGGTRFPVEQARQHELALAHLRHDAHRAAPTSSTLKADVSQSPDSRSRKRCKEIGCTGMVAEGAPGQTRYCPDCRDKRDKSKRKGKPTHDSLWDDPIRPGDNDAPPPLPRPNEKIRNISRPKPRPR